MIEAFTEETWTFWDGVGLIEPSSTVPPELPASQVVKFTPRVHLAHQAKANGILNETRAAILQIIKLISSVGVGAIPGSQQSPEPRPYEDVYKAARFLFEVSLSAWVRWRSLNFCQKIAIASHRAQTIYTEPLKERMFEVALDELELLYHALNVPASFQSAKPADVLAYYTPLTYAQLDEVETITDPARKMQMRADIRKSVKAEQKRQAASLINGSGASAKDTSSASASSSRSRKSEAGRFCFSFTIS